MTLRHAWVSSQRQLSDHGICDAWLEAEVLLRHTLSLDRAGFFASLSQKLENKARESFEKLISRRLTREPLAYITGHREFFSLDLELTPDVLIPRQETELLVEAVIEYGRAHSHPITVADVGTGSGCIAIAIAIAIPSATVLATDLSTRALKIAHRNCLKHHVEGRVHLLEGDLLNALDGPVDVVVCNPPYLTPTEIQNSKEEVKHEPQIALLGGEEGTDILTKLFNDVPRYLKPGGLLCVEIDPRRANATRSLVQKGFAGCRYEINRDLVGVERTLKVWTTEHPSQAPF